jgi:hypothetical protein
MCPPFCGVHFNNRVVSKKGDDCLELMGVAAVPSFEKGVNKNGLFEAHAKFKGFVNRLPTLSD